MTTFDEKLLLTRTKEETSSPTMAEQAFDRTVIAIDDDADRPRAQPILKIFSPQITILV